MSDSKKKFDVVVLGGGPGGYVAAIRASQDKSKSVALIEAQLSGGTCLNRGCIPTKTLLAGSDVYRKVLQAKKFGITVGDVSFDYKAMVKRKDQVVGKIRRGLDGLIGSNGITVLNGFGKFVSPTEIKVTGDDNCIVEASKIIIATGSEPLNVPAFPFDHERVHCSTSVLELQELPESMAIIGAGYIGCEFASLFASLGVRVTLLEALPRIVPMEDSAVSNALAGAFKKAGIEMHMDVRVKAIDRSKKSVTVQLEDGRSMKAEMALVSVGRKMNTDKIGLETIALPVDRRGCIKVNEKMETEISGIYAIGDVTGEVMLAHVASHQGMVAAENVLGGDARMHYHAVPAVIFTHPEIASVGYGLDAAKEAGFDAKLGQFPFQALGKSQAALEADGFGQIVFDQKTGQLLGAQVVGHEAATLIAEMAVAIANELTLDCLTETIHAHPTIAEVWLEAGLVANDTPIHFPPKPGKADAKKEAAHAK